MKIFVAIALAITSLLATTTPPYVAINSLPPRLQWNHNQGYCGEMSMIVAGLYYGQYCSQYTARALASPGVPQYCRDSQLLVGVNDQTAATSMALNLVEWDTDSESNTDDFLAWIKQQVLLGYPVGFGVFANEYLFYGNTDPHAGDCDYDHIVVAYGVGSQNPLPDKSYQSDDTLYFEDHGLWDMGKNPPYLFNYLFDDFQADRREANAPHGAIYSLNNDASNYGFAITGVLDQDGVTVPVRLAVNINNEIPEIPDGGNEPPPPIPLVLTATASLPDPTAAYNLYLYKDFSVVPTAHFNAHASAAAQTWQIPAHAGSTYVVTVPIMSNETAVFRCVPASAP